jgi:hypothetical protein
MPPSPTCSPAATAICLPEFPPGDVTASLDWATADHAVAVVNNKGTITEQFLVDATGAGLRELVRRLRRTDAGCAAPASVRSNAATARSSTPCSTPVSPSW